MELPICIEIPPLEDPFKLTLPGGIEIERIDLLDVVQPALAPLMPMFRIVDTIVALFNCLKAIPDALGPPPDPTALAATFPELAKRISELLQLMPQLSLPYMVRDLIDLVIDVLRKTRRALVHLQEQMQWILRAVDRATNLGDAGLMAITVCAQANVAQEAANLGKMLASLGKMIGLLNLFLGMLGLPEVPNLSSVGGQPLNAVIEPTDTLIETFERARSAVPLP